MISGKYIIEGRNFSWISQSKNAVFFTASLPSLAAAILKEVTLEPWLEPGFSERRNCVTADGQIPLKKNEHTKGAISLQDI